MHNKFEKDTWENFSCYRAHKVKLLTWNVKNRNKLAILNFFSAIIELVRELLISNMHNKFKEDTWKTLKLERPQGQINYVKCEKSQ